MRFPVICFWHPLRVETKNNSSTAPETSWIFIDDDYGREFCCSICDLGATIGMGKTRLRVMMARSGHFELFLSAIGPL